MGNPGPQVGFVPGVQLGRYQLLRQLAIGGMAQVYLARAGGIEGFSKLVVLKRILPQFAGDPSYVAMFLDEARLAARLVHPNIVQVFDVGAEVGDYFIAMEYADGKDVRAILSAAARQGRRVPLGVALGILQAVCRGLHFAHDCTDDEGEPLGVVHRDVTPANVIVTYDGSTKLLDFGVAKASSHTRETQSGTLKGKIGYMSPEQCLGEPLDRRSDVFAIGILLYELTTGARLFREDAEFQMLLRIVNEDAPAPSSRQPDYPPELEGIVRRALARDRRARHATAQEIERELAAFARAAGLDDSPLAIAQFLAELFPAEQELFAVLPDGTGPHDADDDPSIVVVADERPAIHAVRPARTTDAALAPRRRPGRWVAAIAAVACLAALAVPLSGDVARAWQGDAPATGDVGDRADVPPIARRPPPAPAIAEAAPAAVEVAPVAAEPSTAAAPLPAATPPRERHRRKGARRANRRPPAPAPDRPKASWDPDSALLPSL